MKTKTRLQLLVRQLPIVYEMIVGFRCINPIVAATPYYKWRFLNSFQESFRIESLNAVMDIRLYFLLISQPTENIQGP
jgi:hypothetical protein